jgi:hypothetical protein
LTCAILGTIFHKQQITSRKLKDHIPASSNTMVAFVGSILKGENGFMRLELCLEKGIINIYTHHSLFPGTLIHNLFWKHPS